MSQLKISKNNSRSQEWSIIILMILLFFVLTSHAAAKERIQIKAFQAPASFDAGGAGADEGGSRFDVLEEIFFIPKDRTRLVVGDSSFQLAPGVNLSGYRQGMFVGLKLNEKRQVVAIERVERPAGR